jgi:hypothetical protein
MDSYWCAPNFAQGGVNSHLVTDFDRVQKLHGFNRQSRASALRRAGSHISCGKIHLRYQPASKNIASRICVCGHCNGAYDQHAFLLLSPVFAAIYCAWEPVGCCFCLRYSPSRFHRSLLWPKEKLPW